MNREELREYIQNNLLRVDNKLKSIHKESNLYHNLINNPLLEEGESLSEKIYLFYFNKETPKCICGEELKFINFVKGYKKHCSIKCSANDKNVIEKRKNTNLKKYGNENYRNIEEAKKTNIKKYGTAWALESKETQQKIEKTNLERYGVSRPLQNKEILNKMHKNFYSEYGVKTPAQNKEILGKMQKSCFIKFGTYNPYNIKKIQEKSRKTCGSYKHRLLLKNESLEKSYRSIKNLKEIKPLFSLDEYLNKSNKYDKFLWGCTVCGTEFKDYYANGKIPRCPKCCPKLLGHSNQEKEIVEWLQSLDYNVEENNRIILDGKELDIYLTDYNLAIEYNGLYWHSIEAGTPKHYHQNKVKMCYNKGIRLLHIWENEWVRNEEKMKNKILYYINNKHILIKPKEPQLLIKEGFNIWT